MGLVMAWRVIFCGTASLFSREAHFHVPPAVWGEGHADPSQVF